MITTPKVAPKNATLDPPREIATFACGAADWRNGFAAAAAALRESGVLVLKDVFPAQKMNELQQEYDRRWSKMRKNLKRLEDEQDDDGTAWLGDMRVRFLTPGRYEMQLEGGAFDEPDPEPIQALVKEFLKGNSIRYMGGLPSVSGSAHGEWHRDVYSLFDDEALEVTLPPIYMTILVPLNDVTLDTGPTEFLLGSHRLPSAYCTKTALALANVGDAVLFNGMIRHRGTKNTSATQERNMIYVVHCKKWYNDHY